MKGVCVSSGAHKQLSAWKYEFGKKKLGDVIDLLIESFVKKGLNE